MNRKQFTRRQFSAALVAVPTIGLAGCMGSDSDDEDDGPENESGDDDISLPDDDPGALTIVLENENGEPVSSGVEVDVSHTEEDTSNTFSGGIENGERTLTTLLYEGDYTITVESTNDEFEPVEEEVTVGEDDVETTIVLEGATGDDAAADE